MPGYLLGPGFHYGWCRERLAVGPECDCGWKQMSKRETESRVRGSCAQGTYGDRGVSMMEAAE